MKKKPKVRRAGIRAAIREWLGITLTDQAGVAAIIGQESAAGVKVDASAVLKLSAAWACVRLIAETLATLPLSMFEKTRDGKRAAPQHWLHFIIHDQPNADSTAAVFWEAVVAGMLLSDGARVEKLMVGGKIVGLQFLARHRLTISRDTAGRKAYHYADDSGRLRAIPADRIWYIPGFSLDGVNGVSAIRYGTDVFGTAVAADKTAARTFRNGLMRTLYYKATNWLTKEQREIFKENVQGSIEREETPLLEGGTDVSALGINPADAQLLESRAFSVEEVCRWFRVPPFMVGHSEKSTSWGTGIEQQMIGFLTFTLGPWIRRLEQAITKDLLTPAERLRFYPKFAVEGLLRADSAARAAFYAAMVNNGVLTRDEVRQLEDREPMGGNAAVLTVQSAMTTLDSVGQAGGADSSNQARAALRAFLGIADTEPQKG